MQKLREQKDVTYQLSLDVPLYAQRNIQELKQNILPDEVIDQNPCTIALWRPFSEDEAQNVLDSLYGVQPFEVIILFTPQISYEDNVCTVYLPVIARGAIKLVHDLAQLFDPESVWNSKIVFRCVLTQYEKKYGVKLIDTARPQNEKFLCNKLNIITNAGQIQQLVLKG